MTEEDSAKVSKLVRVGRSVPAMIAPVITSDSVVLVIFNRGELVRSEIIPYN